MLRQTFRIVSLFRGANIKYGQQRLQSQIRQLSSFKNEEKPSINESNNTRRILIPAKLHKHLFPNALINDKKLKEATDEILDKLVLPKLSKSVIKNGLMTLFDRIGKEQFARYEELLDVAAKMKSAPEEPKEWSFTAGWTKYDTVTGKEESVEYPDEKVLFFNVRVCKKESKLPCMAVAMSPTSWYSWCSDRLVNDSSVPYLTRLEHLIPLEEENGSKEPKIVIGHNVEHDRPRVREQYYHQDKTGTCFWDTLSMNTAIFGAEDILEIGRNPSNFMIPDGTYFQKELMRRHYLYENSLNALHSKLCIDGTAKPYYTKSLENQFSKEGIEVIRENFQSLTTYCAENALATFEVFQKLYPLYREKFPHPITNFGIMEMGSAYLPITDNWCRFLDKFNQERSEKCKIAADGLAQASFHLAETLSCNDKHQNDPWMFVSDWKIDRKTNKPKWYLNLFSTSKKAVVNEEDDDGSNIKFSCRDFPRIFGMRYGPYPLYYITGYGWGCLVPNQERVKICGKVKQLEIRKNVFVDIPTKAILELIEKNHSETFPLRLLWSRPATVVGLFYFYRLLHFKNSKTVGNPLGHEFLSKSFDARFLKVTRYSEVYEKCKDILDNKKLWEEFESNFKNEITVWFDEEAKIGAMSPAIISFGNYIRPATHALWSKQFFGTYPINLRTVIECPNGWKFVGANVDSIEKWLNELFTKNGLTNVVKDKITVWFDEEAMLPSPAITKTPILDSYICSASKYASYNFENLNGMFQRSVLHSSAVDCLHMLLICMKWLCEKYQINATFVLSFGNEIRYMVSDEDKYRCALALNLSNMYVRAAILHKLGINELSKSDAFLSKIDIDTVLRKDVDQICETPDGLDIPFGEDLNMEQIIEKTGGSLVKRKEFV